MKRLIFYLGLRHLISPYRGNFASIGALFAVVGIGVGVSAIVIVVSVMTGFSGQLTTVMAGTIPPLSIGLRGGGSFHERQMLEHIESVIKSLGGSPGQKVIKVAPAIYQTALISQGGQVVGGLVEGLELQSSSDFLDIHYYMTDGSFSLENPHTIVIGALMAEYLGVKAGDKVLLTASQAESIRQQEMEIAGIFHRGMYELDRRYAYTSLAELRDLLGTAEGVSVFKLKPKDTTDHQLYEDLRQKLGPHFWVRHWKSAYKNLFAAIEIEKKVLVLILSFIILVASFNLVSTLIMIVREREKEIAILQSMGFPSSSVVALFSFQGGVLGLIGVSLGLVGGLSGCFLLEKFKIVHLAAEIYFLNYLPARPHLSDLFMIAFFTVSVSFLGSIFPAWRAAQRLPVDGIRYEKS